MPRSWFKKNADASHLGHSHRLYQSPFLCWRAYATPPTYYLLLPQRPGEPTAAQPAPTICRNSWWDTFQQGSSEKSVNPTGAGGCERSHHQLGWAISGTTLTNGPLCHSTPAFLFQPSSLSFSQTETPRISWSRIWYRADKLEGTGKNWHEQIDSGAIHNTEHVIKGEACVDGYPAWEFSFTDGVEVDGRRRVGESRLQNKKFLRSILSLSLSTPPHLPYHRLHGVLDLAGQGKEFNEQLAPSMVQSLLFSILGMCCWT